MSENYDIGSLYDLIVVGGGPAGLSAAIYMARARYKVLVLEKNEDGGGQIRITSEVVNYPGILKTSGKELMNDLRLQAKGFGVELMNAEAMDMDLEKDIKIIHTTKGEFKSLGVILALGANPRKLGFKGEKEFQGRGVAYCATCDGEFFTDMEVFVVGGGFAAVEEGMFLTKYASHVHMIVREPDFTCAKTIADKIKSYDKIDVRFNTEVEEVAGNTTLESIKLKNNETGSIEEIKIENGFGVFVFAGYVPNTSWITENVNRDLQGYIITDANQRTNIDCVYAAGDVCIKQLRQVVTAVSDGATAATSLEKDLAHKHEIMNIPQLKFEINKAEPEENKKNTEATDDEGAGFFTNDMKEQIRGVLSKLDKNVVLKLRLDNRPISGEVKGFMTEFADLSDRLSLIVEPTDNNEKLPETEVSLENQSFGIKFHGVPSGHEINSFILAVYNVGGVGKAVDSITMEKIKSINKKKNIKILASLSCTMCPEVVMGAQRIASLNENVEAEMYDLMHFPKLKERYKVMSVPCMIINDSEVHFGKKTIDEIAEILNK